MLTRRQSVRVVGVLVAYPLLAAKRIPLAVQLFSLRRQCEQELEGTLAYVREIGFDGVELAGFYGRTAAQIRALLDKYSLQCCGSHTPLQQLTGDAFDKTLEDNNVLRNRYVIIPGLPKQYEGSAANWRSAADVLNELAGKCQPAGLRVGYHNHDVEFRAVDGILPWEILYEHTRPEVILQLDTGNARVGGADPTTLIRRYPGRAVTVHVKDYLPGHLDPVLGSSDFNWAEFLTVSAARGGTEWYIIEHDSPQREEAKVCFDRLRRFQDVNG